MSWWVSGGLQGGAVDAATLQPTVSAEQQLNGALKAVRRFESGVMLHLFVSHEVIW